MGDVTHAFMKPERYYGGGETTSTLGIKPQLIVPSSFSDVPSVPTHACLPGAAGRDGSCHRHRPGNG